MNLPIKNISRTFVLPIFLSGHVKPEHTISIVGFFYCQYRTVLRYSGVEPPYMGCNGSCVHLGEIGSGKGGTVCILSLVINTNLTMKKNLKLKSGLYDRIQRSNKPEAPPLSEPAKPVETWEKMYECYKVYCWRYPTRKEYQIIPAFLFPQTFNP